MWCKSQERLHPWLSSHSLTPLALLQLEPLSDRQVSLTIKQHKTGDYSTIFANAGLSVPAAMRLIDVKEKKFKSVSGPDEEPYAILSHTWLRPTQQEVTFKDFLDPAVRTGKTGWNKILQCCKLAEEDVLKYVWIDTCCIDKSDSAELQEALNSMYSWYQKAAKCYAFLSDGDQDLSTCKWFTRGWTLQELLAPKAIRFYHLKEGNTTLLGTRDSLATKISSITNIDECYLKKKKSTDRASVAHRMSWISKRETERHEDMAYCMLGLFDVNLPLLYGEGWCAFRRLQEAIIAKSDDESIFAWKAVKDPKSEKDECRGMIASFPWEFQDSGKIQRTDFHRTRPPYNVTNRGVSFRNPARSVPGLVTRWMRQSTFNGMWNQVTRAFYLRLNCQDEDGRLIAIKLAPDPTTETFYRTNSATLERCAKERCLSRMAVLYGGYEELYIKAPESKATGTQEPAAPITLLDRAAFLVHSIAATFSFDNLLLCLVVQSFSCFVLTAHFFHHKLHLEPLSRLNVFLGWAYLTLGWKALGQNFYFWFGALTFGLLRARSPGMEMDTVKREMIGALLAPGMLGVATLGYTGLRRWTWGRNMQ